MSTNKSFKPSSRKLLKARREGQVLKGQFLSRAAAILAILVSIINILNFILVENQILLQYCLSFGVIRPEACFVRSSLVLALAVGGVLSCSTIVGVLFEFIQVGLKFEFSLLRFKPDRLDPLKGLRRLFTGIKDLWLRLITASLIVVVLLLVKEHLASALVQDILNDLNVLNLLTLRVYRYLGYILGFLFVIFSVVEYGIQYKRFCSSLSMSLQEVREEHKEIEGDPQWKSYRKALHEEILMKELVQRVRSAKVIIVERM